MDKIINIFKKIVIFLTLFFMTESALASFFAESYNIRVFYDNRLIVFIVNLLITMILMRVVKSVFNYINKHDNLKLFNIFMFIFIILCQLFLIFKMDINQVTDPYVINDQALSIAKGIESSVDYNFTTYFVKYANNNMCLLFVIDLFKIFLRMGINVNTGLLLVNLIMIDLGIFFIYKVAEKIKDKKFASKVLFLNIFNPLNVLLVGWTYTCTYCLPFMTGILYLFLLIKDENSNIKKIIYSILFGIIGMIGYLMRPVMIIPFVAFFMCFIIYDMSLKEKVKRYGISFILIIVTLLCTNRLFNNTFDKLAPYNDESFPTTHWIMMGLHGYGVLDGNDVAYTLSFKTKEEKKEANIEEIKRTLKEYKVLGLVKHELIKIPITWAEGQGNYAKRYYQIGNYNKTYNYITGDSSLLLRTYNQCFRILILLLSVFGLYNIFKSNDKDKMFLYVLIIFGAIMFYALWEAKSVYSYPFIPYLLLLSVYGMENKELVPSKKKGIVLMISTLLLSVLMFNSLCLKEYEYRNYSIRMVEDGSSPAYVSDVASNDKIIMQEFTSDIDFNKVRLYLKKVKDNNTKYVIQLLDSNNEILNSEILDSSMIGDSQFYDFDMIHNKGDYKLVIKSFDDYDDDSIKYTYIKSKEHDHYKGSMYVDDEKLNHDLKIAVYNSNNRTYFNKVLYILFIVCTLVLEYLLYKNKKIEEDDDMSENKKDLKIVNKEKPVLNLVIPCYNEEKALPFTERELNSKMEELIKEGLISKHSKVVLVNDGSKDNTWEIITKMHEKNKMYVGINLSRNRGHQNALLAGLMYAKDNADISISMDADLQDDINVMNDMIKKYLTGCDVVYGVRSSRKKDTFFKKFTAEGFYKFMSLMGVDIVFNHADCRLMSKRALEGLEEFEEVNLFLRGIVPQIGYKTDIAYYERNERVAGESKYPLKKMLSFAFDGITSFSVKPLKMITCLGFIMFVLSIFVLIYSIIMKIIGNTVSGWTFIVCSIWLVAGVQTLCLGIVGEYIGKIYSEVKHRPRYIIETILD